MPDKSDVREIDGEGGVSKKRFDQGDFTHIASQVIDDYHTRKRKREDREKAWKDIDRQIAMEPELAFKKLKNNNGKIDKKSAWMAETELPLQAQALEVLTADAAA
jgi:hypothetical protein